MIYISIISSVFFSVLAILFLVSNTKIKATKMLLESRLQELEIEKGGLFSEREDLIRTNEKLMEQAAQSQRIVDEFEQLRLESHKSTKAALFEMGNELSRQLIDIHKKENETVSKQSEERVQQNAEKFNTQFEKLVGMVGSLHSDINQSKDTVDLIKNSLLSPSGAGHLAEITLENLLKNSGLRSNLDFTMQYSITGEQQQKLRPDAVVFLPANNIMVIDSKSSKFLIDDKDDAQKLAKTMAAHLKSLASKEYAENVKKSIGIGAAHVITLMFLPSEHAIEKLIEVDKDFMSRAQQHNIFPVGPAGVMNMLSFAKFQITQHLLLENHQQIVDEVKKLMQSVGKLSEYSAKMGSNIQSMANNYDRFAASFNNNFLSKAKVISRLGVDVDSKKIGAPLARYQIVSSKQELIDIETSPEEEQKKIEG